MDEKYNEALERARTKYDECIKADNPIQAERYADIFPELKESEDERIFETIYKDLHTYYMNKADSFLSVLDKNKCEKQWLEAKAWLKKHKEQKPGLAHILEAYKISDERAKAKWEGIIEGRKDVINNPEEYGLIKMPRMWEKKEQQPVNRNTDLADVAHQYAYDHFCPGADFTEDYVKGLIEDAFYEGANYQLEQQFESISCSHENNKWGEEDERVLETAIAVINLNVKNGSQITTTATPSGYIKKEDLIKKLKSLRLQPHTVPVETATRFGNLEYERGVKDGIQSEKNRHWKPSEEQINALNSIILTGSFTYVGQTQDLISLKDELKKL